MSQLILDEQINQEVVLPALRKWITVQPLIEACPGQHILDERIPSILRTLKQPTLVTIDRGLWRRDRCHPAYCILYFALRSGEQEELPGLLRALLRHPEFRTRAKRMGKVARVSEATVDYWQFPQRGLKRIAWRTGKR